LLKDFVKLLTTHYAIVVGIRPDDRGRALIKLEQTLIPDLKLKQRDRLKVILGCRPVDLSVHLRNASTCQSYHLKVNAPAGLHLAHQEIIECDDTLKKDAADTTIPLHYRFRRRLGQPHAHFYARFFPEPAPKENPSVRFGYYENLPVHCCAPRFRRWLYSPWFG
jgi:hypothetical protein